MFAVMPLTSPKDAAVLRPVSSGASDISRLEGLLIGAAAAFALATLAPSLALAIAVVAGIGGVAWIALRVRAEAPTVLADAQRAALSRATYTQISFAR